MADILPPLPAQPANGPANVPIVLFPVAWHWIGQAFQAIHADNEANAKSLAALKTKLEALMATAEELQTSLDANTAATAAAATAIQSEINDLAAAIAALTPGDPVTQAQIDQLNASTSSLQAATAALTADDAPAVTP